VITEIINVDTEYDGCPLLGCERRNDVHQFGLAVKTPIGVVDPVGGPLHFLGHHRRPLQIPLLRQRSAVGLFVSRQGWGDGRHGVYSLSPEGSLRSGNQERRVSSATEGNNNSTESVELGIEHRQLAGEYFIDEFHRRSMPE
jgi:hypothetical protein